MLEYYFITDINEFVDKTSSAWDSAVLKSGQDDPFLLSDFIICWWKYFSGGRKLLIFVISSGREVIGGIPLCLSQGSFRQCNVRVLSYIGGSAANYTMPLYADSGVKVFALLKEALSKRSDWDILHLSDLKNNSLLLSEYKESGKGNKNFLSYLVQDHMNWAVDLSSGKEDFLSKISADLKKDLRAKRKHVLNECGDISLREISSEIDLARYFDMYVDFSVNAFGVRNRDSNFQDRCYVDFFREFLLRMARKSWLDCHVLFAGDNVLAISFGYRFGKGYNWVLTGFNYRYKHFRPGYLLVEELINEVIRRKETYFNWYGHERLLKRQWCNRIEPLYQLFLVRPSVKGFCFVTINRIENTVRSNRPVLNLIRRIKYFFSEKKGN